MKRTILTGLAVLMTGALPAAGFAQETQPAPVQVSPAAPAGAAAAPAAPAKKKAGKKKTAKKAAAKVEAPAVIQEPAPAAVAAAEIPQVPQVEAAPAAVSEPVKPEAARRSACPSCFQPLLAGYNEIVADLKPWMEEMDVQAGALDFRLSAIQKRINEKDDAIEKAKLGTDKKEVKAAVKALGKERKTFLNEYTDTRDEKEKFYATFSEEVEKKIEAYNKMIEVKKQMALSAASSQ